MRSAFIGTEDLAVRNMEQLINMEVVASEF